MKPLMPCIWFDDQAEPAAKFYTAIWPNSRIVSVTPYPAESPSEKPVGSVMTVIFELDGQPFQGLNGGKEFKLSEAISFVVQCSSQDELDRYNQHLLADGGKQGPCGWVTDKFGVSWQIVPAVMDQLMSGDPVRAARVMKAMLGMMALDLAALEKAHSGS